MTTMTPTACFARSATAGSPPPSPTATSDVLAFKDIGPKAPLHELVIPLDHHATLAAATEADAAMYGRMMVVAARCAAEGGHAAGGFRVVMNAGPDAGQSVHHVHLHVLAGRPLAWPPG